MFDWINLCEEWTNQLILCLTSISCSAEVVLNGRDLEVLVVSDDNTTNIDLKIATALRDGLILRDRRVD